MPYHPQRMARRRRRGAPWWVLAAVGVAVLCSLALIAIGAAGWVSMVVPTAGVIAWALTWTVPLRGAKARRAGPGVMVGRVFD